MEQFSLKSASLPLLSPLSQSQVWVGVGVCHRLVHFIKWFMGLIFFNFQDPSYGFCDLGGAYVCETQTRLLTLAKQLGVETYQVFGQGQSVEHFLVN